MSNGRQVLRFRPTPWERLVQLLEITSGELLRGAGFAVLAALEAVLIHQAGAHTHRQGAATEEVFVFALEPVVDEVLVGQA